MNVPTTQTSNLAIVSLVMGVACWMVLPVIGSIIAIVCGHMARAEIRRSLGTIEGDGMALAGLILGYIHIAFVLLVIAIVVVMILGFGLVLWH
jgi:Domain of unknown function (DUF4190)